MRPVFQSDVKNFIRIIIVKFLLPLNNLFLKLYCNIIFKHNLDAPRSVINAHKLLKLYDEIQELCFKRNSL